MNLENAKEFLTENPHFFGIFIALFGLVMLVSAIVDANWLFGDVNTLDYNLKKIDGWVNFFGRRNARIISGIGSALTILAGIAWFLIYAFYY
jgi:hypothetical protein